MYRDFKIFGERNTSTNALCQAIEANSASRILALSADRSRRIDELATKSRHLHRVWETWLDLRYRRAAPLYSWKHAAPPPEDAPHFATCLVVMTFRHPASWLLGLQRRPYHSLGDVPYIFDRFLRSEWNTLRRDRLDRRAMTPIALYNEKVAAQLRFRDALQEAGIAHETVTFEDFAVDQEAVFDRLRPFLLDPAAAFQPIERSTKDGDKDRAYYRDHYANHRWLDSMPDKARRRINAGIDWEAIAEFGYRPVPLSL